MFTRFCVSLLLLVQPWLVLTSSISIFMHAAHARKSHTKRFNMLAAPSASSVFLQSRAPPLPWFYSSCITDASPGRALASYSMASRTQTVDSCIATCDEKGYTYAGIEYGGECYCANQVNRSGGAGTPVLDSQCNMPCPGDQAQKCGDVWRMSLYGKNSSASSAIPPQPTPKLVVAHHMVGNTYSYSLADWVRDVQLASSHGIDGFALNIGSDPWQPSQVASAFTAASGSSFKLFLSLDMTSLPCSTISHTALLRQYVTTYSHHPNQLKWNGKVVVSTFSGEDCTFGKGSVNAGWQNTIKDGLPPVHFIPSFFNAPSTDYPVTDGDFNWNGGWPMGDYDVNFDSDNHHIAANAGKTYMAAVSPWFFTHYGPNSWNKNWIYRGDDWLYNTRWEQLISNRNRVDIVQIVTWNDYGESSYIGPIGTDQPRSQAWVDGFDHQGWLDMTMYYAMAFKTGSYPAIKQDKIYLWARPHPAGANAPDPAAPRPNNAAWTKDYLWAVIFAVSPAQVTLTSGTTSQTFTVPTGVTKLKLASSAGAQSARLERNNADIVSLTPNGFNFTTDPQAYNFNVFVAASS